MLTDNDIEQEIQDKGLKAPRVTLVGVHEKVQTVEYVNFTSASGQILCWAVLTLENGFAITGKPSVAVSPENNDIALSRKIAINNAMEEIWELEGYLLKQKLYEGDLNGTTSNT